MQKFSMDPKLGEEAVAALETEMNGAILEYMKDAYDAVASLGDNNVLDQNKEKFTIVAGVYNDRLLPNMQAVKQNLLEFTNLAEFMNKYVIDTSVKHEEVDPVKDAGFGDAASML